VRRSLEYKRRNGMPAAVSLGTSRILRMGNLGPGIGIPESAITVGIACEGSRPQQPVPVKN
jgi:hypothetical protein